MTDHYRTLGVARSAKPEEIRAAYLSLMKLHHPDALRREQVKHARDEARELNRAYAVLRDPAQRAAYDAQMQLKVAAMASSAYPMRMPVAFGEAFPAARRRRSSRLPPAIALALVAAAAGGLLGMLAIGGAEIVRKETVAGLADADGEPPRRKTQQPPIDSRLVIDAASDAEFIFRHGNAEDAVMFSRGCFAELAQMPTLKLLDRCVSFDLASSRWLAITKMGYQTSFFSSSEMDSRHGHAFRRLAFGPEARKERLQMLDRLAVTEIALRLNAP